MPSDVENVENPSADDAFASPVTADSARNDAASCLEASDWTENQVTQLQALLDVRDRQSQAQQEQALRRFAGVSAVSAPNWHQSVVYFATSEDPADAKMRSRAPCMFVISALIVLIQCLVATGLYQSSTNPSCVEILQCLRGQWCEVSAFQRECIFCGGSPPLPLQLAPGADPSCYINALTGRDGPAECPVLNDARADYFAGFNATAVAFACAHPADGQRHAEDNEGNTEPYTAEQVVFWCDACYHGPTRHVEATTEQSALTVSVSRMSPVDWTALLLASLLVGLTVSAELKDIALSETLLGMASKVATRWKIAFGVLNWARRWFFLPSLAGTVPQLVLQQGSNALTICLNAVAILFLADIDNALYLFGLGDDSRARVEQCGRVVLNHSQHSRLTRLKWMHIVLVAVLIVWSVASVLFGGNASTFIPRYGFLVGGLVESVAPGRSMRQTAGHMAIVVASWIGGMMAFLMMMGFVKIGL